MMKMKTKTAFQKTQDRMQKETNRAVAHVEFLKNLYKEMVQEQEKHKKKIRMNNDV
jgi:hypothetical protein